MNSLRVGLYGGLVLVFGGALFASDTPFAHRSARVVVSLRPGTDPLSFARQAGLTIVRSFQSDSNVLVMEGTRSISDLRRDPRVVAAYRDRVVPRVAHSFIPNDPYYFKGNPTGSPGQWYLKNSLGGPIDARIVRAWGKDRTGAGVVIGVVDDGIQTDHPDLVANYDSADSFDFVGNDTDPSPGSGQDHGTVVAGVAAARGGNSVGITGAAPFAGLAGLKVDLANSPESDYVDATLFHNDAIGVKLHAYGAAGRFVPMTLEPAAIEISSQAGCINVYSAGNDRTDSATQANLNSPGTVAVAAVGSNGTFAAYSNFGANVLCTAPSSRKISVTNPVVIGTDRTGTEGLNGFADQDYTNELTGTSASGAVVAGVMALLKQTVPTADARLAKHLLARTCEVVDAGDATSESDGGWHTNAAGFHFNQNYGFGLVNAFALTELAKGYAGCSPLVTTDTGLVDSGQTIPDNTGHALVTRFSVASNTPLEEVSVYMNLSHPHRGDLEIYLIAPSGTQSRLLMLDPADGGSGIDWTFTSNAFWGENPKGTWTLKIFDRASGNVGTLGVSELITRGGIPLPAYDAQFVSQNVPTTVTAGSTFTASMTYRNVGFFTWDKSISLISQNPANNDTWGKKRLVNFGTIDYGKKKTFTATFTAPSVAGTYDFQWRLKKTGVGYFGPATPNVSIAVTSASQTIDVSMLSMSYSPQTANVHAGDTVRWTNTSSFAHTVTPDVATAGMSSDTTFPSGLSQNQTFSWKVPSDAAVGTKYFYHCRFHGTAGNGTSFGTGMTGVVVVN